MSIRDKALLVSLSVSLWTNAVHDEGVVSDIMKKTGTDNDVHRYKKVLVKPEALTQVRAARVALRQHWWSNTLPWGNGGVRILPSSKYQAFVERLRTLRIDYDKAVDKFCDDYPKMKAEARRRLKELYDDKNFPSLSAIRSKFGCEVEFAPIPDASDFRVKLSESERDELAKDVERALQANAKGAMNALVEKLQETVELLSERLKEDEPILRRSLVENIKEVCAEVDAFNLVDDKKIESFKKATEVMLKGVNFEELKDDRKKRVELATKADDILAKMAGYTGGNGA
jgi:hypothetical protein